MVRIRFLGIALCLIGLISCSEPPAWKIGFMATMSGRGSDVGIDGRDGAILAVEDRNRQGGIRGRPMELVPVDLRHNTPDVIKTTQHFRDMGIGLVIGPMTSAMAVALPQTQGPLFVSPTVTTTQLEGRDDNFIRVISTTRQYAARFARYQYQKLGLRRVAAIFDIRNQAYTHDWFTHFQAEFTALGGKVIATHPYRSQPNVVFHQAVDRLLSHRPDSLMIISNALDAGMIIQQVRKRDKDLPLCLCEWASTNTLLRIAGLNIENVYVTQFMDPFSTNTAFKAFLKRFENRFGRPANFAALAAYDACLVAFQALELAQAQRRELKQSLLEQGTYQGLQQKINLDTFGDARRRSFIFKIHHGQYLPQEY